MTEQDLDRLAEVVRNIDHRMCNPSTATDEVLRYHAPELIRLARLGLLVHTSCDPGDKGGSFSVNEQVGAAIARAASEASGGKRLIVCPAGEMPPLEIDGGK